MGLLCKKIEFKHLADLYMKLDLTLQTELCESHLSDHTYHSIGNLITYRKLATMDTSYPQILLSDDFHRVGRIGSITLFEKSWYATDSIKIKCKDQAYQLVIEGNVGILTHLTS